MSTQGQKNPKRKSKLREYTSEFILDGANQFIFTFPIFMIPLWKAFDGDYLPLIVYLALMTFFFFAFFMIYGIKNKPLAMLKKPRTLYSRWDYQSDPRYDATGGSGSISVFLKNYGFGSTAVFLTIALPMTCISLIPVLLGTTIHKPDAYWFGFIAIVGWDTAIYTFSIAAGMERQFTAWKRDNITRNMTSAQYADFLRDEYLAERGRAAGFNEGYMAGRNSRH